MPHFAMQMKRMEETGTSSCFFSACCADLCIPWRCLLPVDAALCIACAKMRHHAVYGKESWPLPRPLSPASARGRSLFPAKSQKILFSFFSSLAGCPGALMVSSLRRARADSCDRHAARAYTGACLLPAKGSKIDNIDWIPAGTQAAGEKGAEAA